VESFTEQKKMGVATYSHENRILTGMQSLGLTADHLATLDGSISPSRLSAAFRGVKDLETPQAERLLRLLAELAELASSVYPVPIAWRNVAAIKTLIEAKRAHRLEIKVDLGAAPDLKPEQSDVQSKINLDTEPTFVI
jgi:sugar/nucleoside kinase (ribokinase family)